MFHFLILGLLFGWGAAIPIGPLNIEIIRRNLTFGTSRGLAVGYGASLADMTYFVVLLWGAIAVLTHPMIIKIVTLIGSAVLIYFGVGSFRLKVSEKAEEKQLSQNPSFFKTFIDAYAMTLFNPYTILFWSSVSAQLVALGKQANHAPVYVGFGVLVGVLTWSMGLNMVLHFVRHKLPANLMRYLNIAGGIILIAFALYGVFHAFI